MSSAVEAIDDSVRGNWVLSCTYYTAVTHFHPSTLSLYCFGSVYTLQGSDIGVTQHLYHYFF